MDEPYGTITLIGSGEFSEIMARVYRSVLARIPAAPNPVFLDTPAGFELNADALGAKAADFFAQRFNLTLYTASFKNKSRANAREVEAALHVLHHANLIVAGPGSPSYALRHWQDSPVWDLVLNRFRYGAQLVLASAAAIAASAYTLPVYEIYKAGDDPFWLDGLDLFAEWGMKLTIVPHWNNAEGGTYDTRFCFLGESRFAELERQLPRDAVVLGIDEYTACLFDAAAEECRVMGSGNVTIRRMGQETVCRSGEAFPFSQLHTTFSTPLPHIAYEERVPTPPRADSREEIARYFQQLARALAETQEPYEQRTLIARVHETLHELGADWIAPSNTAAQANISPLLDILIHVREQLRAAKLYPLADDIRERVAALDIALEDNSAGTTWRQM